jgi:hypothetical protein
MYTFVYVFSSSEFQSIALDCLTIEEKEQFKHILNKLIQEIEPKVTQKGASTFPDID